MSSTASPTTILVADRSALARAWSERLLADEGHRVIAASDGAEALRLARSEAPDVVVLNDALSGLTGRQVIGALRQEGAVTGIVILTGRQDADAEAEALMMGADDAVRRPCHARELAGAVSRAEAKARARRSRRVRDERLDGELRAAAAIQAALLPRGTPAPSGYRLDWAFLPAREVGGDLVDVLSGPDGSLLVMLADVSGKGLEAALLSGMARTALRAAFARGDDPAEALTAAGALLYQDLEHTGAYLTAFALRLEPGEGRLTYADAGHGHHLLLDAIGGERPLGAGGPPLGLVPRPAYDLGTETIAPGEMVAIFSDGLVEGDGEPAERRRDLLQAIAGRRYAYDLVAAAPEDDDRTLLVLERDA